MEISTTKIKKMLESFYEGNTNKEEEKILIAYFNSDNVADELKFERDTFLSIYEISEIDVPLSLETKINELINKLNDAEITNNNISNKSLLSNTRKKNQIWSYISIAACLIILITGSIYLSVTTGERKVLESITLQPVAEISKTTREMSVEDKEILVHAESAMLLVSQKLNKGMDQLTMASSNVDKTNKIINKTLKLNKEKKS